MCERPFVDGDAFRSLRGLGRANPAMMERPALRRRRVLVTVPFDEFLRPFTDAVVRAKHRHHQRAGVGGERRFIYAAHVGALRRIFAPSRSAMPLALG